MFCLEHPKRDQNLKFTLLPARRRASPHLSYGSSPPPGFAHGNFNFFTGNSFYSRQFQFYSRQFQFAHGNFNLFTAISICSRRFQFTHGNFAILLRVISIFSQQRSRHFSLLTTCQLRRPTVATHQKSKHKIESGYLQSIFKEKSENRKSKVDLRTSRTRGYLHETGTNSDWCEFVSVAIHFFSCVYRTENELRPV